ncbi:hypothetical protein LI221_09740 [Faecalimonas umbilicata]|nr:hypothetical protein [Faecalimonas umbilicata]
MRKRYLYIASLLLCMAFLFVGCKAEEKSVRKVIPWEMGFLAVGDQGEVLEITPEGEVTQLDSGSRKDFTDVCNDGENLWIVGEDGMVLRGGRDFSFEKEDTQCDTDLNAVSSFGNRIYCGGNDGVVLCSDRDGEWKRCVTDVSGAVTGMAASDSRLLLVTDAGEAAVTEDGYNWTVLKYSEYYGKEAEFQGLIYDGTNFWANGVTQEGAELFYTDTGNVWAERDIHYLEGDAADLSEIQILSMVSDGQQLYAWCEGGELYTFPDCVQCNKRTMEEAVQTGAAGYNGGKLLLIADAGNLKIMDTELAKQYLVSGETAYLKMQEGAVLIDVRSREEHAEGYIENSICIPLNELPGKLEEAVPDKGQTIIFYCAKGIRSQSAVEEALKFGYAEVYSMGSIKNWKHELAEEEGK